jgi:hypothetical protein
MVCVVRLAYASPMTRGSSPFIAAKVWMVLSSMVLVEL